MTAEHYVTLILGLVSAVAVVLAAIMPGQIKAQREARQARIEQRTDHARVSTSVEGLSGSVAILTEQVGTLTTLIIETASDLKAHTKWEEGQKYATPEHIERLIVAVADASGSARSSG